MKMQGIALLWIHKIRFVTQSTESWIQNGPSIFEKNKRWRKASAHVSLRGLRRLIWVETFRKHVKPAFQRVFVIYISFFMLRISKSISHIYFIFYVTHFKEYISYIFHFLCYSVVYKEDDRRRRDEELAEDCCLLACCWATLCCCLAANS